MAFVHVAELVAPGQSTCGYETFPSLASSAAMRASRVAMSSSRRASAARRAAISSSKYTKLQDCVDEAVRKGAREVKDELVPRLDRQDETLRLMWKQMKSNGRLPIDD